MRFEHVCIESIAVALPEEIWTSAGIEERLRPLYERLRLPFGRLELMSGIRERRFWPVGTRPSDASATAGRAVLARSAIKPEEIEAFMHAAVCRDMLEPATAAFAHRKIGLSENAQKFDVSNACLGFLNSLTILGAMIESGQIRCGMVVAGEAAGGQEALDLLAGGLEVDLVILDHNMPGLSGSETLVRLRARHPGLPVLLSTGFLEAQVEALAQATPGVWLLNKPYALGTIRQKLQDIQETWSCKEG